MKPMITAVAIIVLVGAAAMTRAGAIEVGGVEKGPRVLVLAELFTSEGCSSCPPADDLLRRLLNDQPVDGVEVVPISEHVDYWDRLGWRDPFSSAHYSERQSAYAHALGGGQIYTPQLVVDGALEAVGNDFSAVRKALTRAAQSPHANVTISATRVDTGSKVTVRVAVSDLPAPFAASKTEVMVAVVEDGLATDVPRGENARRRLRHDAVARGLTSIGTLASAGELTGVVDVGGDMSSRRRIVVFLQDRTTRRIAGVATTDVQGGAPAMR